MNLISQYQAARHAAKIRQRRAIWAGLIQAAEFNAAQAKISQEVLKMKTKTVLELGLVKLQQTGKDRFTVVYFKQITKGLTYSQAAMELGCCLMHQAACGGLLDNE